MNENKIIIKNVSSPLDQIELIFENPKYCGKDDFSIVSIKEIPHPSDSTLRDVVIEYENASSVKTILQKGKIVYKNIVFMPEAYEQQTPNVKVETENKNETTNADTSTESNIKNDTNNETATLNDKVDKSVISSEVTSETPINNDDSNSIETINQDDSNSIVTINQDNSNSIVTINQDVDMNESATFDDKQTSMNESNFETKLVIKLDFSKYPYCLLSFNQSLVEQLAKGLENDFQSYLMPIDDRYYQVEHRFESNQPTRESLEEDVKQFLNEFVEKKFSQIELKNLEHDLWILLRDKAIERYMDNPNLLLVYRNEPDCFLKLQGTFESIESERQNLDLVMDTFKTKRKQSEQTPLKQQKIDNETEIEPVNQENKNSYNQSCILS